MSESINRNFTFRKEERLKSKSQITKLFSRGKRFYKSPFQVFYLANSIESEFPVQVLIAVPKKKIKISVKRNLLKRRIREAYRLNKHILYNYLSEQNRQCSIAIVYNSHQILDYKSIEKGIIAIFEEFSTDE